MSRRHTSPRTRPVAALLIVVATLFLLASASSGHPCGVVGALLSASVARLLGDAGTGLLVGTAWCIAFILATPPGTLTRMVVATWRACVSRRHRPSVVVMRPGAPLVKTTEPYIPAPALAPRDRQTLDAVRNALKHLDYTKAEYEPLIARMDPSLGFEKLVRGALKSLREVN